MPGLRNPKRWREMTGVEIYCTQAAFVVIGGSIAAVSVYDAVRLQRWSDRVVPLLGVAFVLCVWTAQLIQAVTELRRRRRET